MATFGDAFVEHKGGQDDFYVILGCDESSSLEQITKEYHVRAKMYHPDKSNSSEDTFTKLNKAYEILSNQETRQIYNSWRVAGLNIPFDSWLSLQSRFKSSMHFTSEKKQLSIDSTRTVEDTNSSVEHSNNLEKFRAVQHSSNESSNLLNQFRRYKI